jgi:hypothetical protein
MTKRINALVAKKNKATDQLANAILAEMDRVARRHKLTCVRCSRYVRGRCHVYVREMDELEEMYVGEVSRDGIKSEWTSKHGWR